MGGIAVIFRIVPVTLVPTVKGSGVTVLSERESFFFPSFLSFFLSLPSVCPLSSLVSLSFSFCHPLFFLLPFSFPLSIFLFSLSPLSFFPLSLPQPPFFFSSPPLLFLSPSSFPLPLSFFFPLSLSPPYPSPSSSCSRPAIPSQRPCSPCCASALRGANWPLAT